MKVPYMAVGGTAGGRLEGGRRAGAWGGEQADS